LLLQFFKLNGVFILEHSASIAAPDGAAPAAAKSAAIGNGAKDRTLVALTSNEVKLIKRLRGLDQAQYLMVVSVDRSGPVAVALLGSAQLEKLG
jgi:hypothetical protein